MYKEQRDEDPASSSAFASLAMLCARLILLVGAVYLANAKAVTPSEDEFTIDDFEEILRDSLGDTLVLELARKRRDVDDEPLSTNQAIEPSRKFGKFGDCPPCPAADSDVRPHPCAGLSRAACHRRMAPPPYSGPPCELRPLFRVPLEFNHTARRECFNKWEKPALEAKGVDFSKPRRERMGMGLGPMTGRSLMIHKGCDVQCIFLESHLLKEDGESFTVSKEAVMDMLKEQDDPQEILDIFEQQIDKCIDEAAELVHPRQSCKSGADEFLECVRFNVGNTCTGARWQGSKSCEDTEDAHEKMHDCRREMRHRLMSFMHHGMNHFRHREE